MEQKYYSVKEIAKIFGLKPEKVRDHCHAKWQRFAFQPAKGGNLMINLKKYEAWLALHPAADGSRKL